jgi:hypothetical protein
MKEKSFIFAHSREIIVEDNGKLDILPNAKYVLLGQADPEGLEDIIVARDLPNNIEHIDKACAYSGWVALVNNNYIDNEDFVYLFEYDTEVSPSILGIKDEIVGYFALPSTAHMFLEWEPELSKALNQVVPIVDYFHIGYAPMTSNIAMKGKWLKVIVAEIENAIKILGNHEYLGHVLERLVVFTIWRYNIPYRLYLNAVRHDMRCSHGQLKGYK